MRHRKAGLKLNRTSSHRDAMFRNMVTSLFKYERIRTTDIKAKELRRWADHIITLAKRGDLHARRNALSIIREKNVVHKLFEEANKRYGSVNGGYTRIIKLGRRPGDAAPISLIELVMPESGTQKKGKKKLFKKDKKESQKPTEVKAKKKETAETQPEMKDAGEKTDMAQPETEETQAAAGEIKTDTDEK